MKVSLGYVGDPILKKKNKCTTGLCVEDVDAGTLGLWSGLGSVILGVVFDIKAYISVRYTGTVPVQLWIWKAGCHGWRCSVGEVCAVPA